MPTRRPAEGCLQPRPRGDRPGRVPPRRPAGRGRARRALRRLAHPDPRGAAAAGDPGASSPATAAASSSRASTTTSSASSTWCAPSSRAWPRGSPPSTPPPEEIRVLWEMVARDRELVDRPDALARANKRFHHQIHLASHNRYLIQQLEMVHRSMALLATTSLAAEGRGATGAGGARGDRARHRGPRRRRRRGGDPRPHQPRPRDAAEARRRALRRRPEARPAAADPVLGLVPVARPREDLADRPGRPPPPRAASRTAAPAPRAAARPPAVARRDHRRRQHHRLAGDHRGEEAPHQPGRKALPEARGRSPATPAQITQKSGSARYEVIAAEKQHLEPEEAARARGPRQSSPGRRMCVAQVIA